MVKASSSHRAACRSSASFCASVSRGTPGSFWAASTKVGEYCVVNLPAREAKSGVGRRFLDFAVHPVLVAHVADELPARVLIARAAEMAAHAPVEILQLLHRVAIDGKSPQEHEAAAVLDLFEHGREIPREG